MDEKTKGEIQLHLEHEISKTSKRIVEYKELTQPVAPDDAIGRVSRMDAINNKSVNEAALRQAELKVRKLLQVLEDIDNPNFGSCYKCGAQIPIQRLTMMPQSRHCVQCAT